MPKKKNKGKQEIFSDDEIIIGYNSKKPKDKSSKSKKTEKNKKKIQQVKEAKSPRKNKKKKKQKKKNKLLKKILKLLLKLIIIVGIAVAIILFLFVSPVFNIQEIEIIGAEEIGESVYIAMSGIEVRRQHI